ncbi:beta-carotene hydroxylase [Desmospora sp. 8437]|nr:beta-carotene hydroxylase [Desmospora sp. 8437]
MMVLDGLLDDLTDVFLVERTEVADNHFGFQLFLTKQFVQFRGNSQDESGQFHRLHSDHLLKRDGAAFPVKLHPILLYMIPVFTRLSTNGPKG